MTSKPSLSKGLLILLSLGAIGAVSIILAIVTLSPTFEALTPMFEAANEGSVDDYETRYIPAESMKPTLEINDRVLINKKAYKSAMPKRGDLIIFNPTAELKAKGFEAQFVKRIIGLPGETIEIKDGKVYIDSQAIEENYILEPPKYTSELQKIPPHSYFVLGDNRNNSLDSHYWGYVPQELIVGKVVSIFFPPARVQEFN